MSKNNTTVQMICAIIAAHYSKLRFRTPSCEFANYTVGLCSDLMCKGVLTLRDMDFVHKYERLCWNVALKRGEQFEKEHNIHIYF